MDVLDHHPAAPETTPIKTYTPAMDLNPEQITVTPRSPSVLAAFARTARVQTHHLVPALTDDSPSPVGQTPPPAPADAVRGLPPLLPGGQAAAAAQTEERRRHTRAPLRRHTRTPLISRRLPPPAA